MKSLFLIAALTLLFPFGPAAKAREYRPMYVDLINQRNLQPSARALSLPSTIPYHSAPQWDFGQAEIKTIRMLRDWENGGSASRPHKEVLVYGPHPHWVAQLNSAGIKAIGMWKRNERWPHYIVGKPTKTPFADGQFQVYIFDEILILSPMLEALHLMFETGRITTDEGFFLYRNTHNGIVATLLRLYKWKLMDIRFHEFDIWQKEGPSPQVDFVLESAA